MVDKIVDYKALGRRIQKRRLQLGISQSIAAEKLDLSTSFYSRVERGERVASLETLIKIANCFELSLDYLLQESLTQSVSNEVSAEFAQIFVDKPQDKAELLIRWLKVLSDNIDELGEN